MVIILTNYYRPESPMFNAKFRGNRSTWSGDDFEGFYHVWAWRSSWSCYPDAANKLSFPLSMEVGFDWSRSFGDV